MEMLFFYIMPGSGIVINIFISIAQSLISYTLPFLIFLAELRYFWPRCWDESSWSSERKRRRRKTTKSWARNFGRSQEEILQMEQRVRFWYFPVIDPRGRPKVTADSDHCFCTCRPFIRPSPLFKTKQMSSENNVHYWRDCGSGRVDHWWHLSCNRYFFANLVRPYASTSLIKIKR